MLKGIKNLYFSHFLNKIEMACAPPPPPPPPGIYKMAGLFSPDQALDPTKPTVGFAENQEKG